MAGTYRMVNGRSVEVAAHGDSLTVQALGPKPMPLVYVGGAERGTAEFAIGPTGSRVVFRLPRAAGAPAPRLDLQVGMIELGALRVKEEH